MTSTADALITELDAAISGLSSARQVKILQSVINLLLDNSMSFSEEQAAVFDDVISRLLDKADNTALIALSKRLAVSGYSLEGVFGQLARHEDLAVAGPVLEMAQGLRDEILVEIATAKGPKHLTAIARRNAIGEAVADVLIERGNQEISHKLAGNPNARLSEMGFVKLINRAKTDKGLATAIASRNDLPEELVPFLKLALGEA